MDTETKAIIDRVKRENSVAIEEMLRCARDQPCGHPSEYQKALEFDSILAKVHQELSQTITNVEQARSILEAKIEKYKPTTSVINPLEDL